MPKPTFCLILNPDLIKQGLVHTRPRPDDQEYQQFEVDLSSSSNDTDQFSGTDLDRLHWQPSPFPVGHVAPPAPPVRPSPSPTALHPWLPVGPGSLFNRIVDGLVFPPLIVAFIIHDLLSDIRFWLTNGCSSAPADDCRDWGSRY